MIDTHSSALPLPPALLRLSRLAPLDDEDLASLMKAHGTAKQMRAGHEIIHEGDAIDRPRWIVSGWAARVRIMEDGRRAFLSFLLPGDFIGLCHQPQPLSVSTVVTLTDLSICAVPMARPASLLGDLYAVSHALEESYLLSHIARLGRLNAQGRISDLLLELHDRIKLTGMTDGRRFLLPLTQEALADAVGLTSVHVNRVLQTMRKAGDILLKDRQLTFLDFEALSAFVGYRPARVSCLH
jgi:CRP-like cAMP-binding protein